ncbi:MAG: hypothetical protein MI921_11595 [Cytophagales bacterium]|nr:hypothetical protein [Cytophagales bacterium]
MELRATKNRWAEIFSKEQQTTKLQRFADAYAMETGDDFVVVCKNGGWIEVYDTDLKLISTEVFLNVKEVSAGKYITVILKNGWSEVYDKWFNMQSVKYCGD